MAERITGQVGPKIERQSVDYTTEVSDVLANEISKPSLENSLPASIAPLPDIKSLELISGRLYSEQLRLAVPKAANPFENSPMGPRHDYRMVLGVIDRADNPTAKQLIALLQRPAKDISERDISHMRASVARENNMIQLLKARLSDAEQIQNHILSGQEG